MKWLRPTPPQTGGQPDRPVNPRNPVNAVSPVNPVNPVDAPKAMEKTVRPWTKYLRVIKTTVTKSSAAIKYSHVSQVHHATCSAASSTSALKPLPPCPWSQPWMTDPPYAPTCTIYSARHAAIGGLAPPNAAWNTAASVPSPHSAATATVRGIVAAVAEEGVKSRAWRLGSGSGRSWGEAISAWCGSAKTGEPASGSPARPLSSRK
ncbi:hypothetical protein CLOP_g16988 [Closterium sp. NIES-67]|nr:hypothetical protein CLOP_g16988 [Closterium sp. NIES-67]